MRKGKPNLNLVVLGHVDSGRSTTTGHLMYKIRSIDKSVIQEYENNTNEVGKKIFKYSWVLNKLKAEKEQEMTDTSLYWKIETTKNTFFIIDTPGHKDFMKNMITGTTHAHCAILVVAAPHGEYEVGMGKSGQTSAHIQLARSCGIRKLIILVNKMDSEAVSFSQQRFNEIKNELNNFINEIRCNLETLTFIPISGLNGDNLTEKSPHMIWWRGPTLLEALNSLTEPKLPIDKPLRVPVRDVYRIGGVGTVPVGTVASGKLKPGMKVIFVPSNIITEVKSVETDFDDLEVLPGTNAGFNIKNVPVKSIKRGFVCGEVDNDPPKLTEYFVAEIVITNYPEKILNGFTTTIVIHTVWAACKFEFMIAKIDRRTGKKLADFPRFIKSGDCVLVRMVPCKPICVERFCDYPSLGRFACITNRQIVAIGIIKHVGKKG